MAGPGDPDSAVFLPRSPPSDAKRIPHADLGASALFSAYADGDPRALAFYAHDPWDAGARAEAAHRAAAHPRDRATLADVLAEQQARWGADEAARANAERLRDLGSAAVVTGQQLGLFGGPLYTLYKALTAVQLASRLAEETGRPVVPVFWLADEDHDFAEVHATAVLSEDGPVRVAYEDGHQASLNRGAVGRLVLGEGIVIVLDAVAAALPRGRHTGALLDDLRTTWAPGARWRDAFARQLASWTAGTGLVLLSADDVRLKRLAAPLFHREVERWPDTHAVHADASARLVAEGFHAQVTPRPFHFFLLDEDVRAPLDPDGTSFVRRDTGAALSNDDLVARIGEQPEQLSPDVVLRPVMQDALLPTAAYVGGPGEVAYFAQLRPVYEAFGIPMPVVYPRASATLVEGRVRRVLDRYNLSLRDLRPDPAALHRRLALDALGVDLDGRFGDARIQADAMVNVLAAVATGVDPSLGRATEAARVRIRRALAKLEEKTARVAKRREAEVGRHLRTAHDALFPEGDLQERALSALSFFAREGPAFLGHLRDALDLDTRAHQIVGA